MKKIYTVFLMVLFLFILTPVHAKDTQNILITGKHLPYIMVDVYKRQNVLRRMQP